MALRTSKPHNILLFGATGSIGKYILAGIVESKLVFGRIAIFTSSSTLENKKDEILIWKRKGVEVILGDITNASHILKAYEGMDRVINYTVRLH